MVVHIVMWNFNKEYDEARRAEIAADAKQALESLVGKVEGLISLRFGVGYFEGGFDACLVSEHVDREALAVYRDHPAHKEAQKHIRPFVCERVFCDFDR